VGKPEGKRPIGTLGPRRDDKMDLQEVGCKGVGTGSSWLRIGTGGGNELSGFIKCGGIS